MRVTVRVTVRVCGCVDERPIKQSRNQAIEQSSNQVIKPSRHHAIAPSSTCRSLTRSSTSSE
eukprot:4966309-Prymnesium_polylepis.1